MLNLSVPPIAAGFGDLFTTVYNNSVVGSVANAIGTGMNEIFETLVISPTGGSIFAAVISPCKIIAGCSFLYACLPLIRAKLPQLRDNAVKIITMFLLLLLFVNDGALGRTIGVANYAVIQGINIAIKDTMDGVGGVTAKIAASTADKEVAAALTKKYNSCLALEKTATDPSGNRIPNPDLTQCETELRDQMTAASVSNPSLTDKLTGALAKGDLIGMIGELSGALGSLVADAAMSIPVAILQGIQSAILVGVQVSFALSLAMMPVAIAFSFAYPSPLAAWFTGIWSLGIFLWALTILTGCFQIINAALGGSAPLFLTEVLLSIIAPGIASGMATFGAIGIFKVFESTVQSAVQMGTKLVGMI
jgi:hypothetical protein